MRYLISLLLFNLFSPLAIADDWECLRSMPTARSEMSAAVWDDIIYVPGGLGGMRAFEAFDTHRQRWMQLPYLPEGRHHTAIAAYKEKIFVFGGADSNWRATNSTWMFDIGKREWRRGWPMPENRYAAAAVVIEPYIYVVGGAGPGGGTLRYDPINDQWAELAPNLQRREHTSAVELDGRVLIAGGRWPGVGELASTEIFDPHNNTWVPGLSLQTARGGFTLVNHKNAIYALGGETMMNGSETLDTVEQLTSDGWRIVSHMPLALHGVPVASYEDYIYVLGGSQRAGAIVNDGQTFRWRQ